MKSAGLAVGETEIPLPCTERDGLSLSKRTQERQAHTLH